MNAVVVTPDAFPREFELALNRGDLERIVALYSEEAVLRVQPDGVRSGMAAVRAEMQQLIAAGAEIANTLRHSFRHGDIALLIVDYVLHLTAPDGKRVTLTGTATNVVQETIGKGWRMVVANPQGVA